MEIHVSRSRRRCVAYRHGSPQDLPNFKALGSIGVMTVGIRRQDHHLMIARWMRPTWVILDGEVLVDAHIAVRQRLEDQLDRHELGEAGRLEGFQSAAFSNMVDP